jgi:ribonuclease E
MEPPEFVHVEMTTDEQEVYSWMGISPLVLTEQEVKNPRNAYIAVTLPGEAPPEQPAPVVAPLNEVRRRPTLLNAEPESPTFDAADDDDVYLAPIVFESSIPQFTALPEETFEEPAPRRLIRQRSRVADPEPIEEEAKAAPKKKRIIIGQKLQPELDFSPEPMTPPIITRELPAPIVAEAEPEVEETDDDPVVRRRRRRSSARS